MPRRLLFPAWPALVLAACVPAPAPTPPPSPAPAPGPAPAPPTEAPAPFAGNWMDAPVTPGDWSYAAGVARFGEPASEPRLTLRCDPTTGSVEIARAGSTAAPSPMIVRTEIAERSLDAAPSAGGLVVARVPARDPLLDALAFSRGRFAVEVGGLPTLYVPAYPEVTRVIEDCR